MADCFVPLVNPSEISGLVEIVVSYHREFTLSYFVASQNELELAQFFAYGDRIVSVLKSRQILWPLCAPLGFCQKIDKFFSCNTERNIKSISCRSVDKVIVPPTK